MPEISETQEVGGSETENEEISNGTSTSTNLDTTLQSPKLHVVRYSRDELLRIRETMKLSLIPVSLPKATSIAIAALQLQDIPDSADLHFPLLDGTGGTENKNETNVQIHDKSASVEEGTHTHTVHNPTRRVVRSASLRNADWRANLDSRTENEIKDSGLAQTSATERVDKQSIRTPITPEQETPADDVLPVAGHMNEGIPLDHKTEKRYTKRSVSISSNESVESTKGKQSQRIMNNKEFQGDSKRAVIKRRNASPMKSRSQSRPQSGTFGAWDDIGLGDRSVQSERNETRPPPAPKRRQKSPFKVSRQTSAADSISSAESSKSVCFSPIDMIAAPEVNRTVSHSDHQGGMKVRLRNNKMPEAQAAKTDTPAASGCEDDDIPQFAVIDTSVPTSADVHDVPRGGGNTKGPVGRSNMTYSKFRERIRPKSDHFSYDFRAFNPSDDASLGYPIHSKHGHNATVQNRQASITRSRSLRDHHDDSNFVSSEDRSDQKARSMSRGRVQKHTKSEDSPSNHVFTSYSMHKNQTSFSSRNSSYEQYEDAENHTRRNDIKQASVQRSKSLHERHRPNEYNSNKPGHDKTHEIESNSPVKARGRGRGRRVMNNENKPGPVSLFTKKEDENAAKKEVRRMRNFTKSDIRNQDYDASSGGTWKENDYSHMTGITHNPYRDERSHVSVTRSKSAPRSRPEHAEKYLSQANPTNPDKSLSYEVTADTASNQKRHIIRLVAKNEKPKEKCEEPKPSNSGPHNPWANFKNIDPKFFALSNDVPTFTGKSDDKEEESRSRHKRRNKFTQQQNNVHNMRQSNNENNTVLFANNSDTGQSEDKSAKAVRNAQRRRRQREKKRQSQGAAEFAYAGADQTGYYM